MYANNDWKDRARCCLCGSRCHSLQQCWRVSPLSKRAHLHRPQRFRGLAWPFHSRLASHAKPGYIWVALAVVMVGAVLATATIGYGQGSASVEQWRSGTARSCVGEDDTRGTRTKIATDSADAWDAVEAERALLEIDSMAIPNYWKGADGDATAAINWTLGHWPTTGEHGICDGRSQRDITFNHDGGITGPDAFITMPEYRGNIGGPGSPCNNFANNTSHWIIKGSGEVYLADETGGASLVANMESGGLVTLSGAAVGNIYNLAGDVIALSMPGRSNSIHTYGPRSVVTLADVSDTAVPRYMVAHAGRIVNKGQTDEVGLTVIVVHSGATFRQEQQMDSNTHVYVDSGGLFEYPIDTDSQNPVLRLNGTLDLSESSVDLSSHFGILTRGPQSEVLGGPTEPFTGHTIDLRELFPFP